MLIDHQNILDLYIYFLIFIFQHALVETEAENIRTKVKNAGPLMRNLMEEINDTIQRLGKKNKHRL